MRSWLGWGRAGFFLGLLVYGWFMALPPAAAQGIGVTGEPSSTLTITLDELDYEEKTLLSSYGRTAYTLRLPEGWELLPGSFFELDYSYFFNSLTFTGTQQAAPTFLGNLIVSIGGETQRVIPLRQTEVQHGRLKFYLPPIVLYNPLLTNFDVEVVLDAGHLCNYPHKAYLIVHPTSLFHLVYKRTPLTLDLARYPRPFSQRSFWPDQVRFVLPAAPTASELGGAFSVAAKLGDWDPSMIISGTTAEALRQSLPALSYGEAFSASLLLVGTPESNPLIRDLSAGGKLPVSLRERTMRLQSAGPTYVAPGNLLHYTFVVTNSTMQPLSRTALLEMFPHYTTLVSCSHECQPSVYWSAGVEWDLPALKPGEALTRSVTLSVTATMTEEFRLENTLVLLKRLIDPRMLTPTLPLNVSTLTTTVSSGKGLYAEPRVVVAADHGDFFVVNAMAVPETDGVVQELIAPWNPNRAILVLTGLSDAAVYKACLAMSYEDYFPDMQGVYGLVREVRAHAAAVPLLTTEMTFSDLGYDDEMLSGDAQELNYRFDLPASWQLTDNAALYLRFYHTQMLDYKTASLSVLFNNLPVATVALSRETALGTEVVIHLPAEQALPGKNNRITVRAMLRSVDACLLTDIWLVVAASSRLYLDHDEAVETWVDLGNYPQPFVRDPNLSDVLLFFPEAPALQVWEPVLRLSASLGRYAGGKNMGLTVAAGDWDTQQLADYHVIAIGRPSQNMLLQYTNLQLPQPFMPQSDLIEQRLSDVILRLPPDVHLGYVQLLDSPWAPGRALMALTGTSDVGVAWAVDTLVNRSWDLAGNLTLIRQNRLESLDTRALVRSARKMTAGAMLTELMTVSMTTTTSITATGGVTATVTPTPEYQASSKVPMPWWMPILIGLTFLSVAGILGFVFWQSRRQRLLK